jgi:small subunit ribosomal protein S15
MSSENKLVQEFQQNPKDTGSSAVQVVKLSERIDELTGHLKTHPKDFGSKRGLLKLVCQRAGFLLYLKRTNQAQYKTLTQRLGL